MASNIIITAGSGINVIPIDALIKKITTNDANVALEANTFYELGSVSLQTLTLPAVSKDGDLIGISSVGSGGFKIVQAAGEQILFGTAETTIGAGGTLETTQINSVLYLRRLLTPGLYVASTPQGEFLIDAAGAAIFQNAINDTSAGSDVTLSATGDTGESLVSDGVGPALSVKKVSSGAGISIAEIAGSLVFSATGGSMPTLIDTQVFTTSDTWTKPVGALFVNILIIGGGGGGASGARSSSASRSGGVGGAYGASTYISNYDATLLGATEAVTVGVGGIGGLAQTVNDTNGNFGNTGVDSDFDKFSAHGGDGGDGGDENSDKTPYTGTRASTTMINYLGTEIVSIEEDVQTNPIGSDETFVLKDFENSRGKLSPSSGGPGQTVKSGGLGELAPGVALDYDYISAARVQAAAATVANPGNNGSTYELHFGSGASGGAATLASIGHDGGDGGNHGGGGGGGGTSANGNISGAGGKGADGVVIVRSYS